MGIRVVSAEYVFLGPSTPGPPGGEPYAQGERGGMTSSVRPERSAAESKDGRANPTSPHSVRPERSAAESKDERATWLRDAAIALDGDHLLAVGPRADVEARFGRGEHQDAVLFPALV